MEADTTPNLDAADTLPPPANDVEDEAPPSEVIIAGSAQHAPCVP